MASTNQAQTTCVYLGIGCMMMEMKLKDIYFLMNLSFRSSIANIFCITEASSALRNEKNRQWKPCQTNQQRIPSKTLTSEDQEMLRNEAAEEIFACRTKNSSAKFITTSLYHFPCSICSYS